MLRITRVLLVALVALLVGCSPANWAAARQVGNTIETAVDTFAVMRAEEIRSRGAAAEQAAARGDTSEAMRELSAALAVLATTSLEELQEVRADLARLRAENSSLRAQLAATSAPADAGAPDADP